MTGLRLSARTLGALTAVKVLVIVGIWRAGVRDRARQLVAFRAVCRPAGAPPLAEALAGALVGTFFSFGGFWEASRIAGEIDRPAAHVCRARWRSASRA